MKLMFLANCTTQNKQDIITLDDNYPHEEESEEDMLYHGATLKHPFSMEVRVVIDNVGEEGLSSPPAPVFQVEMRNGTVGLKYLVLGIADQKMFRKNLLCNSKPESRVFQRRTIRTCPFGTQQTTFSYFNCSKQKQKFNSNFLEFVYKFPMKTT